MAADPCNVMDPLFSVDGAVAVAIFVIYNNIKMNYHKKMVQKRIGDLFKDLSARQNRTLLFFAKRQTFFDKKLFVLQTVFV